MADKSIPIITPEVEARFWARVDQSPGQGPRGECWHWTGSKGEQGYPRHMRIDGHGYTSSACILNIRKRVSHAHVD